MPAGPEQMAARRIAASSGQPGRASPLARFSFVVYVVLMVYASLYPFGGWRDQGHAALAFVTAPWPRYVTLFDIAANVLGYLPFGMLGVIALYPRVSGRSAVILVAGAGTALSVFLEATQSFLPSRFSSNVDLLCNAGGALAGSVIGVMLAPWLLDRGPLRRMRERVFHRGAMTDAGLALLALWLFAQLDPGGTLFGVGDMRGLLPVPAGFAYGPKLFVSIEAVSAAAHLIALALIVSALAVPGQPVRVAFVALVVVALVIKTSAFAILMRAENVHAWLTPGAQQGLAAGMIAAMLAVRLSRVAGLALAAMLLMTACVLVNLAPTNPYLETMQIVWKQGHFLNFNGLTRLVAFIWPYAMLAYLTVLSGRRALL